VLFAPDTVQVISGAGTTPVDAIAFIGARIGAEVEQQSDINDLNGLIGTNGTWVMYQYIYNLSLGSTVSSQMTVPLYQSGQIPAVQNGLKVFLGPTGALFSFVAPAGTTSMNLEFSRQVQGPWSVQNANATEGSSGFAPFTGIPGNDAGFYRLVQH